MSASDIIFGLPLRLFRKHRPRENPLDPRIVVIRRNRMGDMIYTLPLLHALRRHYAKAYIAVACDPAGAEIARSCSAVDEVIVLKRSWVPWRALVANAAALQNFDWVIAAKGGFDGRLASLTQLTGAARRIGFERAKAKSSTAYTDPVAPPDNPFDEHQIETLLRLLKPLGMVNISKFSINLSLTVPETSQQFATSALTLPGFRRFMLINISSTVRLKFREEDFIALATQIVGSTDLGVIFVAAPADQSQAVALAGRMASDRVHAVGTPGPLDLAALLQKSVCLFTPEGGAAHLAASVGTPAVVLWSEGPFNKWHSRGENHVFVHAENKERTVPVARVWEALQPLLGQKK
jgi:ADP-heptose:LPS heptosyltransferase